MAATDALPFGRVFNARDRWAQNAPYKLSGTTLVANLAKIQIPGGMMGPSGDIALDYIHEYVGTGGDKTITLLFGNIGQPLQTISVNTETGDDVIGGRTTISNRRDTGQQIALSDGQPTYTLLNVDTEKEMEIIVQGKLALRTDAIILQKFNVKTMFRD